MVLGTGMPTRGCGIEERKKKKSGASEELLQAKVYFRGAVEDALGKSAAPR